MFLWKSCFRASDSFLTQPEVFQAACSTQLPNSQPPPRSCLRPAGTRVSARLPCCPRAPSCGSEGISWLLMPARLQGRAPILAAGEARGELGTQPQRTQELEHEVRGAEEGSADPWGWHAQRTSIPPCSLVTTDPPRIPCKIQPWAPPGRSPGRERRGSKAKTSRAQCAGVLTAGKHF